MLKKILAGVSAVVLSLGLIALVASPASAHDHTVTVTCSSVKVDLSYYNTSDKSKSNSVEVWINGVEVTNNQNFGASFSQTYTFDQGLATNTYRVKVVAWDNSSYSFDTGTVSVDRCPISVTPGTPQFTDAPCAGPGIPGTTGQYFIPTTAGVTYSVKLGGNSSSGTYVAAVAGWNDVPAGTHVWIKATADDGYVFSKYAKTSWDDYVGALSARQCIVSATPHAPTYSEPICSATDTVSDGTVTIPSGDAGVQYWIKVGGGSYTMVAQGAALHYAQGTTVTVKATALDGYDLVGSDPKIYPSHTFDGADARKCVVAAAPQWSQFTCTGPGTHTDASYTIVATNHVTYKINGSTVTGGPNLVTPLPSSFTITAVADNHYTLVGASSWDLAFTAGTDCLVNATAGDPLFVDSVCNDGKPGSTQGSFELVAADHVTYSVNVNGTTAVMAPGVYNTNPGDVVEITAIPDAGYQLTNSQSVWDHTFANPGPCTVTATPVKPGVTDQTCTVNPDGGKGTLNDGYIDIPNTTGVVYSVNGSPVGAGKDYLSPGDYTVTAAAQSGYVLSGYPEGGWVVTIGKADLCGDLVTHPVVTPLVTQVQLGCSTGGSYTLANDLSDATAVIWTVNGSPVAQGTYQVTSPQTVTVHAAANGPDFGFVFGQQQDWTLTFVAATTCDLKTLALTGSTPQGGMLLAYFLLLAGLGIVTVRAVHRHGRPQE